MYNLNLYLKSKSKLNSRENKSRALGRCRHRGKDNIRMELKEIDVYARNWIHSVQKGNYVRALVNGH